MKDSLQRSIDYIRISVTDRCNLRCIYCQPKEGVELLDKGHMLNYEELEIITRVAADLGIVKVRITGGEPLVRHDLDKLVRKLAMIEGIDDISLTTNGTLLKYFASNLHSAGLNRVNISLDTLKPDKYREITRFGELKDVLDGIDAAKQAGLSPIKINVVVMQGINDEEVKDFAKLTITDGWHVRFIELMPFALNNPPEEHDILFASNKLHFVSNELVRQQILSLGSLEPAVMKGNGPAKYYRYKNAKGTVGFISPISEHFCYKCNRLRLTIDGKLRPCLLSDNEIDLLEVIRKDKVQEEDIKIAIIKAIQTKPARHLLNISSHHFGRYMSQLGG